ncbi:MAG: hypothetical protein AAGI48_16015 [Verrucomicrobiota bacterium]
MNENLFSLNGRLNQLVSCVEYPKGSGAPDPYRLIAVFEGVQVRGDNQPVYEGTVVVILRKPPVGVAASIFRQHELGSSAFFQLVGQGKFSAHPNAGSLDFTEDLFSTFIQPAKVGDDDQSTPSDPEAWKALVGEV